MESKDWVTLGGIAITALISGVNLWLQMRDRGDRYVLRYSSLFPHLSPYDYLYVVNRSKHELVMVDYGFIETTGRMWSLPFELNERFSGEDNSLKLLPSIAPGTSEEACADFSVVMTAAYAISSTQTRPRLSFKHGTPWRLRLAIRWHSLGGLVHLRNYLDQRHMLIVGKKA
jgi:hypothetical protein